MTAVGAPAPPAVAAAAAEVAPSHPVAPAVNGPDKAATPAPRPSGGSFSTDKEFLRSLTKWIMTGAGAIAGILAAGSQLVDLGSLDTSQRVSVLGHKLSRFAIAVGGLSAAFAGLALAIAMAAWVQTTSRITLAELVSWRGERHGWLAEGVRWRTKQAIEDELEQRGVAVLDGSRVTRVVHDWRTARAAQNELWDQLVGVTMELAALRTPRLERAVPASWNYDANTSRAWLRAQAGALSRQTISVEYPKPAAIGALADLEKQMEGAYKQRRADFDRKFELVTIVMDDASYLRMAKSFAMTLKYLVLSLVVTAAGIACFAWATHPPDAPSHHEPTVTIVPLGGDALPKISSSGCDASTLQVLVAPDSKTAIISAAAAGDSPCDIIATP
jgi:hypothetical protein